MNKKATNPSRTSNSGPEFEPLVRASKVAKLLDVSSKTVYRWATSGTLPHRHLEGTTVRFLLSEIRVWVDCQGADGCRCWSSSETSISERI